MSREPATREELIDFHARAIWYLSIVAADLQEMENDLPNVVESLQNMIGNHHNFCVNHGIDGDELKKKVDHFFDEQRVGPDGIYLD